MDVETGLMVALAIASLILLLYALVAVHPSSRPSESAERESSMPPPALEPTFRAGSLSFSDGTSPVFSRELTPFPTVVDSPQHDDR